MITSNQGKTGIEVRSGFVICILFFSCVSFAKLENSILEKDTWKKFSWEKLNSSKIVTASEWKSTSLKETDEFAYLKETEIKISGVQLNGVISKPKKTPLDPGTIAFNSTTLSRKDYDQLFSKLVSKFGPPKLTLDSSWSIGANKNGETISCPSFTSEWEIKNTRIKFIFLGVPTEMGKDPSEFVGLISFKSKDFAPELKPLLHLKCSYQMYTRSNDGELIELDIFLDQEHHSVLNRYRVVLSNNLQSQDGSFEYTIKNHDLTINHRIDRYSGKLSGESSSDQAKFSIKGNCEQIKEEKKKF